ncbi:glycoside hydrolase family 13 protein [Collybia nuda]|uniref:alpha-amylase n=1 Tax=Collybia nuda TaxID=64659 RepID=A0A9P5YG27_9AGAR|nr:glycoside hydrolase family 13 protein [Collybia nuda]
MLFSTAHILPALFLAQSAFAATADEWRGRSIYQLLTDRFATTNNSSSPCDTTSRKYCGGTWKGITAHLDYIQAMGFDAVWISPIVENLEGETAYGEAYHGYWTKNINKINTNFGTEDDLNELSAALHTRGMFLMVDVVVNHLVTVPDNSSKNGQDPTFDYSEITPFSTANDYHPFCLIQNYDNQTDVEQCWIGDKVLPLSDLDTEDPEIVTTMNEWIAGLVKKYKIDGVRIDTVKHVRKDFWPDFAKSAGVFTIGEILDDKTSYLKGYTEVIDSVLDYPTWFPLKTGFTSPQGNLSAITEIVVEAQKTYKNGMFMTGSFLENHDQERFQAATQDQALVKNAMTWPFINDGVPILYYGQEQGYTGGNDPNNREALWPTGFDTSKPLVDHVKTLNAARKAAVAANDKFLTTSMSFIGQSDSAVLAVSKPPLLGLLTNAGNKSTGSTKWTIPGSAGLFKAGESVVNVFECKSINADDKGGITVQANGGMPQLMMPASMLGKAGGLCPSITAGFTTDSSAGKFDQTTWTTALIAGVLSALSMGLL